MFELKKFTETFKIDLDIFVMNHPKLVGLKPLVVYGLDLNKAGLLFMFEKP